jgi:hypothetical protein
MGDVRLSYLFSPPGKRKKRLNLTVIFPPVTNPTFGADHGVLLCVADGIGACWCYWGVGIVLLR